MSQNRDNDPNSWAAPPPNYAELTRASASPMASAPPQTHAYEATQQSNQRPPVMNVLPPATIIVAPVKLGKWPERTTCYSCKAGVQTKTSRTTGTLTYLVAALICFVGGGCGCCLIPFCVDSCKDVEHFCPNCGARQGRYSYI